MAGKQFADNFEEIARAMSPVAPDKVAVEMKPFIESLPKPLKTTKDLLAIVLTGKQIVVQCRADTTDMQRTRWARCEPYSYFSFLHLYKMMIRQ